MSCGYNNPPREDAKAYLVCGFDLSLYSNMYIYIYIYIKKQKKNGVHFPRSLPAVQFLGILAGVIPHGPFWISELVTGISLGIVLVK